MSFNLQSYTDFIIASGFIVGAAILGWLFKRYVHKHLKRVAEKTNWQGDDVVLESVETSSLFWFLLGGIYMSLERFPFDESIVNIIQTVVVVLLIFSILYYSLRLTDAN